jgi:hypothetical protein
MRQFGKMDFANMSFDNFTFGKMGSDIGTSRVKQETLFVLPRSDQECRNNRSQIISRHKLGLNNIL